jgi:nucleoside-diphosphate-sugar epimerase
MRVLVTGATGAVGKPAVRSLVAAGHDVDALARSDAKAHLVRALGAQPVTLDLFDPDAVATAVKGYDAVVNLATHIPPTRQAFRRAAWRENDRLRREASRNLVDGALAGDVERYVQESVAFWYEDRGDKWIDEDVPFIPPPFAASTLDAERQAQRFAADGRAGVVLRFGGFYGADSVHTRDLLRLARRGLAMLPGRRGAFLPSVHTDDAGAAVAAALGAPPGTYNVVDDEPLTRGEYLASFAAAVGVPRVRNVGGWLSRLPGATPRALGRSQRVSNRRFQEATGWSPRARSVRDGLPAVVAAIAEQEGAGRA